MASNNILQDENPSENSSLPQEEVHDKTESPYLTEARFVSTQDLHFL